MEQRHISSTEKVAYDRIGEELLVQVEYGGHGIIAFWVR